MSVVTKPCTECGTQTYGSLPRCYPCRAFEKATKIPFDDPRAEDPIFTPGGSYFYGGVPELLDHYASIDEEPPEYVWCTEFKQFELDLDWALQGQTEDHHEAIDDFIEDLDGLRGFVEEWSKKQVEKKVGSYDNDYSTAILIPEKWRDNA